MSIFPLRFPIKLHHRWLDRITGLRLQNVYDVSSKLFLFKFAKPDIKEIVLIESGIRIHLTQYARDKGSAMPGGFCMKLRKHLRTKRLTSVRQLGMDRVVDFTFGTGESAYHVIAEFYAAGNVILTNSEYEILSLLRVVSPDENTRFAVGERYHVESARQFHPVTVERLLEILQSPNVAGKDQLRKVLGTRLDHPQSMVEHCMLLAGMPANTKVSSLMDNGRKLDTDKVQALVKVLLVGDDMMSKVAAGEYAGYITYSEVTPSSTAAADASSSVSEKLFSDFNPFLYTQNAALPHLDFPSYNRAVDEYFYALESQKLSQKSRQQEEHATKKIEAVRSEQLARIDGLVDAQLSHERKAQLIEMNLERVDQAILVVRSAVASGMDWVDLTQLVKEEQTKRNPVALLIVDVKLQVNAITLLLSEPDFMEEFGFSDSEDEEQEEAEEKSSSQADRLKGPQKVDVNISLSAYANAKQYYQTKKASAEKQVRTEKAVSKAVKSAERQIQQELAKTKVVVSSITKIRKPFWFERYHWFLSSENYLVIGGRDAQQNELLVKKHLRKGDVYVHADLPGSSSVLVKNPSDEPISPVTLSQAGTMAICHSRAWDAKIVTSAWWVYHDQVSKTAPTGEYLTTGSFMIRGKKNYLPPSQLVFGFGLMFRVAEECIGRHLHERRPQLRNADSNDSVEREERVENEVDVDVEESGGGSAQDLSVESLEQQLGSTMLQDASPMEEDNLPVPFQPSTKSADTASLLTTRTAADKYELEEHGDEDEKVVEDLLASKEDAARRKYVSAKQRRREKKGTEEEGESVGVPSFATLNAPTGTRNVPVQPPPKTVRGKNKKQKKMRDKYSNQDDEERQLRMDLLQSAGKAGNGTAEGEEEELADKGKGKSRAQEPKQKQPRKTREEKEKEKMGELHYEEDLVHNNDESREAMDGEKPEVDADAEEAAEDREEIQRMLAEENVAQLDQDDLENLNFVDALTGNPIDQDILLSVIPVSAPFAVLQNYKYRVKLIPGGLKKGKATKAALQAVLAHRDALPQERELIKSITEAEVMNTMLAKVKILAPGVEQQKGKKGKKSGK